MAGDAVLFNKGAGVWRRLTLRGRNSRYETERELRYAAFVQSFRSIVPVLAGRETRKYNRYRQSQCKFFISIGEAQDQFLDKLFQLRVNTDDQ